MPRLFRTLVHKSRRGRKRAWTGWLHTMAERRENRLDFAAKRIRGKESLIIATNMEHPRSALRLYRRRWGIECLFSDAKTRGFNIEDTHITDSAKLSTHLGIVTLAVTWAHRCATRVMGAQANPPEDAQTAREVLVPNRVRCSSEVDHLRPG